jgi:flavorubredoxin
MYHSYISKAMSGGGMAFLDSADAKLVCSDLSSKSNLTGWHNIPVDHISFWDNEVLKTGKRQFRFIMTPHVHHWDSMMIYEETTKSLFPSDLFIQSGKNKPVISEDLSESMIALYRGAGYSSIIFHCSANKIVSKSYNKCLAVPVMVL